MNNKKAFVKNIVIVVLGFLFFVLIIKFFPVVSSPDYQNVKKEEISDNFKAEALKYEGKPIEGVISKLSEEEQKMAKEKAASEKPKEEVKIDGTNEISKTEIPAVTAKVSPKKTGASSSSSSSSSSGQIITTSTISTTSTTPESTTTSTTPESTTTSTTPESTTTSTTPESSGENIITDEDKNSSNIENEGEQSSSNSGNSSSRSNRHSIGSVPAILIGQQISEKINNVVETLPVPVQEKIEEASKRATVVTEKTAEVVSTPAGQTVTVAVTSAGAVAGASISASAAFSINALVFSDSLLGIVRLWGVLLSALGLRKRNKPWGSVYDSVTKQPLDPVYVSLEDMDGKEVASAITDLDGRYGFLTQAGKYKLNVHKTNYEFPSKKAFGKNIDQIYTDLYFGETIDISNDGEVVTKNIPMDAVKFDWNEFEKNRRNLMKFYSKRNVLFARIADILFSLGLLITLISTITAPGVYNIIILVVYIILYIIRAFSIKPKSYGSIVEKNGGSPLSFGIIHVKKSSNEIVHKVADKIGRFYCLIPNGVYEISIDKKVSDEEYVEIYKEDNYEVKNGHINKKFQV